jgi:hypothetical protein
MPASIRPDACPWCHESFRFGYSERRHARMPVSAQMLLLVGILTAVVLIVVLLVFVGELISGLTAGMDLRRKERGLIFALTYVLAVPVGLLPAWLGWWYASSRPRKLRVSCPVCQWSGVCQVEERAAVLPSQAPLPVESEFEGIPIPENPVKKRLERLEERKRKQSRQAQGEADPNPDLDFNM